MLCLSMKASEGQEVQRTEWLLYKGVHLRNTGGVEKVPYKSTSETMNRF